ncbi:MAG TPA: EAL domain-containing protein [Thermoanaerobaculia bacterium]|nr:EAL domain-containing protein [Thermoanaerobaculia bacterium]
MITACVVGGIFWLVARVGRRRYLRQFQRMAFHDPLTDLPNRLLFMDRAAIAFAHAKREGTGVAVVFLDLDRFKIVNDSFGHSVGDEVLRGVARKLREHVREVDTVARVGGDEFTLIMPGLRVVDDVIKIASKLLDVFHLPMHIGGRDIHVTASIGISMYPEDAADADALLKNADTAMYRGKQRGGDNFQLYTRELDTHAREELELEARLRRALALQQFILYYQPRVDAATGSVVAFEALLRWNDPDRGLIMPSDFIRTAESSGLIVPIGRWAIQAACRQAAQWHRQGCPDLVVSVNLSPRQFHHTDLTRTISEALRTAGLAPQYLELEVDETCVMHNAEVSMRILQELKAAGVRVLIADFGAGYSSLSYLRRFPIDGLKLARSFLSADNIHNRSLATAALGMARALHIKVIGEGVETQETADFLRSQSCDNIQGFLFSAPLPAQDCQQFMRIGPMG